MRKIKNFQFHRVESFKKFMEFIAALKSTCSCSDIQYCLSFTGIAFGEMLGILVNEYLIRTHKCCNNSWKELVRGRRSKYLSKRLCSQIWDYISMKPETIQSNLQHLPKRLRRNISAYFMSLKGNYAIWIWRREFIMEIIKKQHLKERSQK